MSRRPHLYHCHVPSSALRDAVEAVNQNDNTDLEYVYLESEATIELTSYHPPGPTWTHGRAFGPRLEIRWQRAGDGFDLLLLTETDITLPEGWQAIPENSDVLPCPDSADPETQALLSGTHVSKLQRPHHLAGQQGDAWIETRIPRPLRYPVSGTDRWVKARAIVYRYHGRTLLTRLVGLEGEENEPQPLW